MSKIQGSFPMARRMENLTGKPLEIAFLKNMTHHHQMGMDMAKLATTHTERPELNKLGLEMIGKQSGEILAMNRWLEEWHQEKPGDRANGPMMNRMMGPQAALKKARGADFDQLFINMMIRHHQGAVQMAKVVQEKSDNEVLKTFADKLINDETQEITQLENWKKEWFPESQ